MAITLFYLDDLSIAGIATAMGITSGAVKAHLYHGRKAIKANVMHEEKKGNKLYGFAAVPLLTLLFELEAEAADMPPALSEAVWNATIINLKAGGMLSETQTTGMAVKDGLRSKLTAISGRRKALVVAALIVTIVALWAVASVAFDQADIDNPLPAFEDAATDANGNIEDNKQDGSQGILTTETALTPSPSPKQTETTNENDLTTGIGEEPTDLASEPVRTSGPRSAYWPFSETKVAATAVIIDSLSV